MKKNVLYILFFTCFLVQGRESKAWLSTKISVFAGGGFAFYQGDLAQSVIPEAIEMRYAGKIGLTYRFQNKWSVRCQFGGAVFHGSDKYSSDPLKVSRGLSFTNQLIEGGFQLQLNQFTNLKTKLIHYLYCGTDLANIRVNQKQEGNAKLVQEKDYSNYQWIHPVGLGVGLMLNKRFSLVYEATFHFSYTDYLDGVSYNGDPNKLDTFFTGQVILFARIGSIRKERQGRYRMPSFYKEPYKFYQFEGPVY